MEIFEVALLLCWFFLFMYVVWVYHLDCKENKKVEDILIVLCFFFYLAYMAYLVYIAK